MERWIIDGRLYERPMTRRGFPHSRLEAKIAHVLQRWVDQRGPASGLVVSGGAAFRLGGEQASNVGIDVAYINAQQAAAASPTASVIEGPPSLAVELLGLITVFRPDGPAQSFTPGDVLTAEPHLPGFRVEVSEIFA